MLKIKHQVSRSSCHIQLFSVQVPLKVYRLDKQCIIQNNRSFGKISLNLFYSRSYIESSSRSLQLHLFLRFFCIFCTVITQYSPFILVLYDQGRLSLLVNTFSLSEPIQTPTGCQLSLAKHTFLACNWIFQILCITSISFLFFNSVPSHTSQIWITEETKRVFLLN